MLYCDPYITFDNLAFNDFNAIEMLTNDALPMSWFFYLNGLKDTMYLAKKKFKHKYFLFQHELWC
jgi:hypothetical protein